MASGDPVVKVLAVVPPATSPAQLTQRDGGSAPVEQFPVWAFDAAGSEYVDFLCVLRGYAGGGLTFTLFWLADTATSGNVMLGIAVRRIQDDAEDIDSAHTYVFNTVVDSAATPNGEVYYATITFTDGADMDSWADGELAWVRVYRDGADASDTMSGDAMLLAIEGRET